MKEWTMRDLIDKLNYYTELYDKGITAISDKEWDELYFALETMEKETGIIYPDSPTQSIYFEKVSELKKVQHNHPMLSLDKTKNFDDIKSFVKGHSWIAMAKMDGLTCSLKYINGELVSAETRGNGVEGEDVTHNAKVITSIPQKINYKNELTVDGEIICTYEDFEQFKNNYKNPRNFASGSIRLLDSKECEKRHLTFVTWDCFCNNDFYDDYLNYPYNAQKTLSLKLQILNDLGFIIVPNLSDVEIDIDNVIKFFKENCTYPIDGVVFKYDDIEEYRAAGRTDHHFKGGLAFKMYDETYETEVKDIEWTMGRTGQLTPVLVYNDIEIDGTICNRASLHNITVMTQLMGGAFPGQRVFIYKANQIIPQVESAQDNNPKHIPMIEIPKVCPYCGKPTTIKKDNDSEVLYCTNAQCEGRLVNKLDHFCGKKGLDINGLSKATLGKFIDYGWVDKIEDLYSIPSLYGVQLLQKPGFGNKSVAKIINAIEESKNTNLKSFISAISIPLIGQTAAKDLALFFDTYEDFRAAVDDKEFSFAILDNFGEEMNNSLKNFNYEEADRLSKILTIQPYVVNNNSQNNSLTGKTIVITGKLTNFKNRNELKAVIEERGGKVTGSISSKTDILINNDVNSTSAKNKTAQSLNIPILSEADFIKQYIEN